MNKQLQNKLKVYSTFTAVAGLATSTAEAQIIHTTVNYTGGYETYNVDIDNDGNTDFVINAAQDSFSFSYSSMPITVEISNLGMAGVLSVNRAVGYPTTYFNVLSGLASGFLVNSTYAASFVSSGALAGTYEVLTTFYGFPVTLQEGSFGQFGDGSEKFVGVQFEIPATGDIHYGWLRFTNVDEDGSPWTLVDMAYNTIATEGILTGQTTSVSVSEAEKVKFFISNSDAGITIKNTSDIINAEVTLVDVSGRLLSQQKITSNELFIENKYASGVYFLRISHNGKAITRKVMF